MIPLGIGGTGRCAHMVHLPMCGFLSSVRGVCSYIGIGLHGGWRWTLDWRRLYQVHWMIPFVFD